MELVQRFTSLPKGRPGWVTFGRTAAGEMRSLGVTPRLTMGERLLGRYAEFVQVDTNERMETVAFNARSATGRKSFTVHLEIDFKVTDAARVADAPASFDHAVVVPMKRLAASEATEVEAADYIDLQYRLGDKLDPKMTGEAMRGPFEVLTVAVRVDPPDDIKLGSEARETLRDIEMRHVEALATGDAVTAENLRRAMEGMESLRHGKANTLRSKVDNVADIRKAMQRLLDNGEPRDSVTMRGLRHELDTYAAERSGEDGTDRKRIEDQGDPATKNAEATPPRDLD